MAQHDYVIANGTGAAVRSDLNNALAAIVSQNSGATAPSPTYAYQFWADTTTGLLKLRNAANSAWITLFQLDGEWSTLPVENGTAAAPSIYFKDSGTDTGFYSPGTDQVAISTGGTGRLFINSSGSVGVGNSSPSYLLDIKATATPTIRIQETTNGPEGRFLASASDVQIGTFGGSPLSFYTNATEKMRLDTSGRLGVGTTSPSAPLHINGTANNTAITLSVGGTVTGYIGPAGFIGGSDSNMGYRVETGNSHVFHTGSTERARIDSSGRLLVGTSTSASAGGVSAQHVFSHSTSSQWAAAVQHTTAAGNTPFGLAVKYTAATPNGTSSDFLFCEDATAIRARIYSNGGLANYSANNANLSDRNAKKDISPAAGTWDCIKEWEIVNYRYKDQPDDADLNLGVIAQQVAESCPEVITVFEEAKDDQPEKLGIKEQQMYWMAIKALQEAQVRIEALEAEVAALKAQ